MIRQPQASENRGLESAPSDNTKTSSRQTANLLSTRLKELDREFNRQSKQLTRLAKKLKAKIVPVE